MEQIIIRQTPKRIRNAKLRSESLRVLYNGLVALNDFCLAVEGIMVWGLRQLDKVCRKVKKFTGKLFGKTLVGLDWLVREVKFESTFQAQDGNPFVHMGLLLAGFVGYIMLYKASKVSCDYKGILEGLAMVSMCMSFVMCDRLLRRRNRIKKYYKRIDMIDLLEAEEVEDADDI